MNYYDILVLRSEAKWFSKILTYSSTNLLNEGDLVSINIGDKSSLGVVAGNPKTKLNRITKFKQINQVVATDYPRSSIDLYSWISDYYPSEPKELGKLFMPKFIDEHKKYTENNQQPINSEVDLTTEQNDVYIQVLAQESTLLRGVTGSGKTQIYARLATLALANKRSLILLVPEIGLIGPTKEYISRYVGQDVISTYHSDMGNAERNKTFGDSLSGLPRIYIGTRSMIFLPYKNVEQIIVDECHDSAYDNMEFPKYNALRVAAVASKLQKCRILYASATPNISDEYLATKRGCLLELNKLAIVNMTTKSFDVIDINNKSLFNKSDMLSDTALSYISESLKNSHQSMIVLNRRGSVRNIICSSCGWKFNCPSCDIPMVYHKDKNSCYCHICSKTEPLVTNCPECKNPQIIHRSYGTKLMTDEVSRLFPGAKIVRFDADNIKADSLKERYEELRNGNFDIIIGTQIIAKGLDLPKLANICLVDTDQSLAIPDYNTEEKAFQLLTQTIGRVGRGHVDGHCVLQTRNVDSDFLKWVTKNDWQAFYSTTITNRKEHEYPPFCFLMKISGSFKNEKVAKAKSDELSKSLTSDYSNITVLGPSKSMYYRMNKMYCWNFVIKSKDRKILLKIAQVLNVKYWRCDIDPANLL
jgi:primosomal protein N' (replication factor Y) (superfamily II helicase)